MKAQKIFSKFNTIYFRLIIAFFIMIILVTLIIGITSYVKFASTYNNNMKMLNNSALAQLEILMEDKFIKRAEKIALDIIIEENFDDKTPLFSHILNRNDQIENVRFTNYLRHQVYLNQDVIDSIEVYYHKEDMRISSATGVSYRNSAPDEYFTWIKDFNIDYKTINWISNREINVFGSIRKVASVMSYFPTYSNDISSKKGLIVVNLNISKINELIRTYAMTEYEQVFITDFKGQVISSSNEETEELYKSGIIDYLCQLNENDKQFIYKEPIARMISYTTLPTTGWRIVTLTTMEDYSRDIVDIQESIIIICMISSLFALMLSTMFTKNIYNPLKLITNQARKLVDESSLTYINGDRDNECKIINKVMDQLSVKVSKLKISLDRSLPMLKNNTVIQLFSDNIDKVSNLNQIAELIGQDIKDYYYCVLIIKIHENIEARLTTENRHFVKYHLIDFVQSLSNENCLCLAADLSSSTIGVVLGRKELNKNFIQSISKEILQCTYENFMVKLRIISGEPTKNPQEISLSYHKLMDNIDIFYFMHDHYYIEYDKLNYKKSINQFEEKIDTLQSLFLSRDENAIERLIKELIVITKTGEYSPRDCHLILMKILFVFSNYARDSYVDISMVLEQDIFKEFDLINNVDDFYIWFIGIINKIFIHLESEDNNRKSCIVETVKRLIEDNISEDLSLDMIAEKVYISPKYLSKVFKDETKINITQYINNLRMEKAKDILLNSTMEVKQIYPLLGFGSSNYFIRKFKEYYGMTPQGFRIKASQKRLNNNNQ